MQTPQSCEHVAQLSLLWQVWSPHDAQVPQSLGHEPQLSLA